TPDKDLAQCVRGERVVQLDRRRSSVLNEDGVGDRFGVPPTSIPDWLALVGDSADGFPGIPRWGKTSASSVLSHYEHIEQIPPDARDWDRSVLSKTRGCESLARELDSRRPLAALFKDLATLRTDVAGTNSTTELLWRGPDDRLAEVAYYLGDERLTEDATRLASQR
ncbi:MAG: 5'-3' exonuclease H3TH domain-containing protein, partial [Acidimicrobiales bacterium]